MESSNLQSQCDLNGPLCTDSSKLTDDVRMEERDLENETASLQIGKTIHIIRIEEKVGEANDNTVNSIANKDEDKVSTVDYSAATKVTGEDKNNSSKIEDSLIITVDECQTNEGEGANIVNEGGVEEPDMINEGEEDNNIVINEGGVEEPNMINEGEEDNNIVINEGDKEANVIKVQHEQHNDPKDNEQEVIQIDLTVDDHETTGEQQQIVDEIMDVSVSESIEHNSDSMLQVETDDREDVSHNLEDKPAVTSSSTAASQGSHNLEQGESMDLSTDMEVDGIQDDDEDKEEEEGHNLIQNRITIENPDSIFKWREDLVDARKTNEFDLIILRQVDFFCDSAENSENYLISVQTCPTKFFTYHCVKAMHLASSQLFTPAINIIWKLKAVLTLYPLDLQHQNYDVQGFHYLLDSTLQHIMIQKEAFRDKDEEEKEVGDCAIILDPFDADSELWNKLSNKSQCMLLAAKLYYLMLVGLPSDSLQNLSNQILSHCQDVAEWFCMDCCIRSRKRRENNLPIVKPKKSEMKSLHSALKLEPANAMVWTLMLETMFDFMRTDDRHPKVTILGIRLETVDDIAVFIHDELKNLLQYEVQIPIYILLEVHLLAANFYGYKNLSKESVWDRDLKKSYAKNVEDAKNFMLQSHQKHLLGALSIHPTSWKANLLIAFKHLQKFERDEALKRLELALKQDSLNVNLALVYIRILIGGTEEQLMQACVTINEAIKIASEYEWPLLARTHLYFLKGCVSWMNGNLDETLRNWVEGLNLSRPHFLCQFFTWSKTQIRKYLWPDTFTNFEVVENLKNELRNLEISDSLEDDKKEAASAFLLEIEDLFPLTSNINKELRKLKKKWFYLFGTPDYETESSDDDDDDGKDTTNEDQSSMCEVIDLDSDNEIDEASTCCHHPLEDEENEEPEFIDLGNEAEEEEQEGNEKGEEENEKPEFVDLGSDEEEQEEEGEEVEDEIGEKEEPECIDLDSDIEEEAEGVGEEEKKEIEESPIKITLASQHSPKPTIHSSFYSHYSDDVNMEISDTNANWIRCGKQSSEIKTDSTAATAANVIIIDNNSSDNPLQSPLVNGDIEEYVINDSDEDGEKQEEETSMHTTHQPSLFSDEVSKSSEIAQSEGIKNTEDEKIELNFNCESKYEIAQTNGFMLLNHETCTKDNDIDMHDNIMYRKSGEIATEVEKHCSVVIEKVTVESSGHSMPHVLKL